MIIFIVFFVIVVFVLMTMVNYRKQMLKARNTYNEKMLPIEKKMLAHMKDRGKKIETVIRMITMNEEALIFVSDEEGAYASIGMSDSVISFPYSDVVDVAIDNPMDGKEMKFLAVDLDLKNQGKLRYVFSDKPFKPKTYVGGIVKKYADDFYSKLLEIKNGNKANE